MDKKRKIAFLKSHGWRPVQVQGLSDVCYVQAPDLKVGEVAQTTKVYSLKDAYRVAKAAR